MCRCRSVWQVGVNIVAQILVIFEVGGKRFSSDANHMIMELGSVFGRKLLVGPTYHLPGQTGNVYLLSDRFQPGYKNARRIEWTATSRSQDKVV